MFHSSTDRNRNFVEEDNCFQSHSKFDLKILASVYPSGRKKFEENQLVEIGARVRQSA